ncbi:MAG: methyltransferase [Meiothermus sp.]|uniref:class I SAM-dependent methyltransferase n=1 Tax=Meiothermus sp. TaxID=1955249 RepID=UPI0025ECAC26|nr:class I SAM-dependent methyltransferase [Meiothermus sp.]MCS7057398.1 methyltransferase [Meiothermus sp.]MCS7193598.1 methyltransferase [Meiothermus sp.]MDW8090611.1 class I SAM-dependent methyltransferase [Meiothermus sp.]MDW8480527.1 class I SAM-dependent methyltransferase [Meiothermus sp.]
MNRLKTCRACGARELLSFLSLGRLPLGSLRRLDQLNVVEKRPQLELGFCPRCGLVQLLGGAQEAIESGSVYGSWRTLLAQMEIRRPKQVLALEGCPLELLSRLERGGARVLYLDPHPERSQTALSWAIPTRRARFDHALALRLKEEGFQSDLILAGHLLAYTHDPNGLLEGLAQVLAEQGHLVLELPNLRELLEGRRFTRFSPPQQNYFSVGALKRLAQRHGLQLQRVEAPAPGLLWVHLGRTGPSEAGVERYLEEERRLGLEGTAYYLEFGSQVAALREALLTLLTELKARGRRIAVYGACPESALLLNFVGLGPEVVDCLVDPDPRKQGHYIAGVHVPVQGPQRLLERPTDYLLLLQENLEEVSRWLPGYLEGGGRCILALPYPRILAPQPAQMAP